MAGSDQSANLQGMLSQLAGTVGEMGTGRNFGANALRQIVRPDNQAMFRGQPYALDNSANLMQMAQWAERNGYDDKSRQYMALADRYQQREIEETKRQKLSEAQLGVSKLLSQMQAVATDNSVPTAERTKAINELSLEAQRIAAAGGMNPVSVVNPTNEFLTYIQTADKQSSAASLLTQANDLKREIRVAIGANEPVKAERLLAQFKAVSAQANALGDPDLVDQINAGVGTIIDKMPDAVDGQRERRATRAFELYLDSGDENDPRGEPLLADDQTRTLYREKIAEHKASLKAADKLEAELQGQRLRNQKLEGELSKAEREGTLIPKDQLRTLTKEEWNTYSASWRNMADAPFRREALNKYWRAEHESRQKLVNKSLNDQAKTFVLQSPTLLEQMETSGWDFSADLDEWVEESGRAILSDSNTIEMLAGVIAGDPDFISADTYEGKQKIAMDKIAQHLYSFDEAFQEAWDANEENKQREASNKEILLKENQAEWKLVQQGSFKTNTYPGEGEGKTYFENTFKQANLERERQGKKPYTRDEYYKIYSGMYKRKVAGTQPPQGSRAAIANRSTDPNPAPRYPQRGNRAGRTSGTGPSVLDRQRANLSPPVGPMGDPEDYETKLKRARQAQPNSPYAGSFLTDFPETTPPYIDPRYRNFGG